MKWPFIFLIKCYQALISPFIAHSCRFHPSCSDYAIEAIEKRGIIIGLWKTLGRILKCNPFHPGGLDPP